jgi:electron transfer flavoprotein alpha subunit
VIVDYAPTFDPQDLKVRVLSRKAVKSAVDYDSKKAVVSFGRGIKDAPEQNIRPMAELAKEIDAEVGVSLPISKKPYSVSESVSSAYMVPDRVIGTSGRKVMPLLYIAAGISGAMQHIAGMKESGFVIAINPDEDSPMKDECDLFIKGRMEDVIPALIEELRALRPTLEARK